LTDGHYYAGSTADLKKRFAAHNRGFVSSTKSRVPAKLAFYCAFENKAKAVDFERYLKSSSGFAFRNKRLITK